MRTNIGEAMLNKQEIRERNHDVKDPHRCIVRLKPILEARPFVNNIRAVCDFAWGGTINVFIEGKPRNIPKGITKGRYDRNIYRLPSVIDPLSHHRIYTSLSPCGGWGFMSRNRRRLHPGQKILLDPMLRELGMLERTGEPGVLGLVLDWRNGGVFLLTEDYSMGGRLWTQWIWTPEEDWLIKVSEKNKTKTFYGYVARKNPLAALREGKKYLEPNARIDIR